MTPGVRNVRACDPTSLSSMSINYEYTTFFRSRERPWTREPAATTSRKRDGDVYLYSPPHQRCTVRRLSEREILFYDVVVGRHSFFFYRYTYTPGVPCLSHRTREPRRKKVLSLLYLSSCHYYISPLKTLTVRVHALKILHWLPLKKCWFVQTFLKEKRNLKLNGKSFVSSIV